MKEKERADVLLVNKGFFTSREKAKASIMAGEIFADGKRIDKAGDMISVNSKLEIRGKINPFVSRGGLKLEKAIKYFKIDVKDKIAMDVGASTGGFTDCLLKNGAKKVYAIDVGYGQLDWSLRNDERVINMERTNIRYLNDLPDVVDIVTIDVSFISLSIVIASIKKFLKDGGELISLIKPQFEAGREKVGKNGVVKDKSVHIEVINKVIDVLRGLSFGIQGITFSPIKGPEGNIEYLIYAINNDINSNEIDVEKLVEMSHDILNKNKKL
ncbi:TlyA family RNA methyltransferase [Thermoanaerobacterium thermosaccharolyticum]|uniref:Hemolysin A n=1 Tax=Thermoanaerobacterium thermosaccharolyticum M0795 TaxID=698948 RepID=L0IJA1_THETR|nr:TlyA family RNA methyltransferase [Thermoanaerobacterium thermosaccharolyticum]AGB18923.1 hemolysin A [Thermoanaerobacterium thermosaccharolyticum M0795]